MYKNKEMYNVTKHFYFKNVLLNILFIKESKKFTVLPNQNIRLVENLILENVIINAEKLALVLQE